MGNLIQEDQKPLRGYLTYAANWGAEIEGARIWDQLDFISVNCYYPISKQESPTDEELLSGMEAVLDKLEQIDRRTDKPMMITEIGLRALISPGYSLMLIMMSRCK